MFYYCFFLKMAGPQWRTEGGRGRKRKKEPTQREEERKEVKRQWMVHHFDEIRPTLRAGNGGILTKEKEGASFTLTRTRDICRRNKTSANYQRRRLFVGTMTRVEKENTAPQGTTHDTWFPDRIGRRQAIERRGRRRRSGGREPVYFCACSYAY